MAIARPEVEWFYDPSTYWKEYGLIVLGSKWAVVQAKTYIDTHGFNVIADGLDSRDTAIGFLKLLKEK